MSDMNVVVGGKDNNKNKLPKQKKIVPFKRVVLYFAIFCAIVAGITAYLYFNKSSAPAPKTDDTATQITAAEIKKAQTQIAAEGTVEAVTRATITVNVSSTGERLTLFIMPNTTFLKGFNYEPASISGLGTGDLVQVVYDKSTMRALQITYGLKT
jgi:hypothetical protein